jgi:hypothetical protein
MRLVGLAVMPGASSEKRPTDEISIRLWQPNGTATAHCAVQYIYFQTATEPCETSCQPPSVWSGQAKRGVLWRIPFQQNRTARSTRRARFACRAVAARRECPQAPRGRRERISMSCAPPGRIMARLRRPVALAGATHADGAQLCGGRFRAPVVRPAPVRTRKPLSAWSVTSVGELADGSRITPAVLVVDDYAGQPRVALGAAA